MPHTFSPRHAVELLDALVDDLVTIDDLRRLARTADQDAAAEQLLRRAHGEDLPAFADTTTR